jgi:hypothetical protein
LTRRLLLFGSVVAGWGAVVAVSSAARPSAESAATVGLSSAPAPRVSAPASAAAFAQGAVPAPRVSFDDEIAPIIAANCLDCHSQDQRKGGLSLATYGDLLDGGKDGPIARPGRSADSMMIQRLHGIGGDQMPKDAPPLSAGEVATIARWIDEGARPSPNAPPAPPPWEAPLALDAPVVPDVVWNGWSSPADRIVAAYLRDEGTAEPQLVSDERFARRVYLDIWGLLPEPGQLRAFLADRTPDKRQRLVSTLLADNARYAEHWVSFWNDLLRNEDGVNYYSETDGRRTITPWLLPALYANVPYDRFVSTLLNPQGPADPEGFLIGVNWRGETSAAVTPWMQASQNTAQVFLGVNLKCNACHDSFVNKWKLKDAYGLASYFSPEGQLQLFRCDIAQDVYADPSFLYPELNRPLPSMSLADRRATAAAIFTDPRNGRLARTVTNRLWQRLVGHGLVPVVDEMDGRPWSPALLDWLASDLVAHGYDLKHLISTILTSRAYQMPAVARAAEPPTRDYVFAGPEVRRMTAEQWSDAIGAITGEWSVSNLAIARLSPEPPPPAPAAGPGRAGGAGNAAAGRSGGPAPSDPTTRGTYVREWRAPSSNLTRALGRPIRDQVISVRATQPTTPQALELVNGDILARRLTFGARRMVEALASEPPSLYNKAVAGRTARPVMFDIDIAGAARLWLVVEEAGSNEAHRVLPVWAGVELVDASGTVTPLTTLTPQDPAGVRGSPGTVTVGTAEVPTVRVRNPSTLVYDVTGRGFARMRGTMWVENPVSDIGATLDPQLRFYVFSDEPNMERLVPPTPGVPMPSPLALANVGEAVDRVFMHALGRTPSAAERQAAEAALRRADGSDRPSVEGLTDLLWVLFVKPEFQLIY